jgi:hypothetical protein
MSIVSLLPVSPSRRGTVGGLADRVAQLLGRDIDAGRRGAVLGTIETDDGVEVHAAAGLKLGDLRVGDPYELAPRPLAEPDPVREDSGQFDDEAVHSAGACQFHSTAPS